MYSGFGLYAICVGMVNMDTLRLLCVLAVLIIF